ncbi:XF1762 family protein [Nonomuraea sp. CA-141351]|uniref:XF1762 family protein n=1 Tax=Nonomuraea sp. CA-141351 TaxID=3239996 RepID=UPI003D8DDCC6
MHPETSRHHFMENWNEKSRPLGELKNQQQSADGRLTITPVAIQTAKAFVAWTHRHLGPPVGAKFAVGVKTTSDTLVGVVIVGRPVARNLNDGHTAEITRLATDGTPNACSALLAAAWRASKAMGYRRLIAYTRADESGTSLRAAGFRPVAELSPRPGCDTLSRPRTSKDADNIAGIQWEITAGGEGTQLASDATGGRRPARRRS